MLFFRDTTKIHLSDFPVFFSPSAPPETSGIRTSGTNGLRSLARPLKELSVKAGYGVTDRSFNPCDGKVKET